MPRAKIPFAPKLHTSRGYPGFRLGPLNSARIFSNYSYKPEDCVKRWNTHRREIVRWGGLDLYCRFPCSRFNGRRIKNNWNCAAGYIDTPCEDENPVKSMAHKCSSRGTSCRPALSRRRESILSRESIASNLFFRPRSTCTPATRTGTSYASLARKNAGDRVVKGSSG